MYELIKISKHDYFVSSPTKIGIVIDNDMNAYLIDGGSDKGAAKKVLNHIEINGWKLKSILNTHCHADHTGGNNFLQTQTGCRAFANLTECAFAQYPILESNCLYGGFPMRELKNKFFFAPKCNAELLTPEILPEGMQILQLPGHSIDSVGFITSDSTVFLGDCLSSRETTEKYKVTFLWDVAEYIKTLEYVKTIEAKIFVPSHAEMTDNIKPLAQYNIDTVNKISDDIEEICAEPNGIDDIIQKVFFKYDLSMNIMQYCLVGSTIRSYLTYLKENGRIRLFCENNKMLWKKA